jgi:hypothetical protein
VAVAVAQEVQRLHPAVEMVFRKVEQDTELGGVELPAGARVLVYTREVCCGPSVVHACMCCSASTRRAGVAEAQDARMHERHRMHACMSILMAPRSMC